MPNELDFMKSRDEKGMPEDEFKRVRDEYDKKAADSSEKVKKTNFVFMGVSTVSFVILNIVSLVTSMSDSETAGAMQFGFIGLIAFPIVLSLFLFDPKAEADKKYRYEADQKIILNALKGNIKLNKIRLAAVIVVGILAVIVNIGCWWFLIDTMGELI